MDARSQPALSYWRDGLVRGGRMGQMRVDRYQLRHAGVMGGGTSGYGCVRGADEKRTPRRRGVMRSGLVRRMGLDEGDGFYQGSCTVVAVATISEAEEVLTYVCDTATWT